VTRGGEDVFVLRARRSASFGQTRTDLEEVRLEARSGPAPGLEVQARSGTYFPVPGDFSLSGDVRLRSRSGLEVRVERLDYSASDGIARSADPVTLRDGALVGSALGLEVAPDQGTMTLLADVRAGYSDPRGRRAALQLQCGRLRYTLSPPRADCLEGASAEAEGRRLQARALSLDLREPDRRPLSGFAEGEARLEVQVSAPAAGARPSVFGGYPAGSRLVIAGERLEIRFDPEGGFARELSAPAGGSLEMRPLDASPAFRSLAAPRLRIEMRAAEPASRSAVPSSLHAAGGVQLRWGEDGPISTLSSEELEAVWSADASNIEAARLRGGWRLEQPDTRAVGTEADLDMQWLEMRGGPQGLATLERAGRLLAAVRLRLPRGGGLCSGDGGTQARHSGGEKTWSPLGGSGEFWVSAQAFEVDPQTWKWRFTGTVRSWQGTNLLEADALELDEQTRALAARGHVVTRGSGTDAGGPAEAERIWVRAPRLDYSELSRRAEYREGVELTHGTSHLAAQELDVSFTADGGRVERALARGEVRVAYQDALGESERAEYAPAERLLRLWTPGGIARAHRRDGTQSVSGMELTFEGTSERIAVRSGARGRSWVVFRDAR
jgi:lipopolysaccharide export system protein LptA